MTSYPTPCAEALVIVGTTFEVLWEPEFGARRVFLEERLKLNDEWLWDSFEFFERHRAFSPRFSVTGEKARLIKGLPNSRRIGTLLA